MSVLNLVKNSSIYSIVLLLQKGINFLLIPLLTAYLTPSDYGIISVVATINAFLNVFYLFGLHGSLNRFYYEFKGDQEKIKKLFGTVVTFVLVNSSLLTLLLLISHEWTLDIALNDIPFYPFMLIGLISIFSNPLFIIYQNSLQARQYGVRYGKNNMAFFVLNVTLLINAVVFLELGVIGVLGALAITNVCFFIYTLIAFRNELQLGIEKSMLVKVLKYSLPILPHTLSGVATNLIDRLLINQLLSSALVGIYSIGNNFGSIVFLVAQGINQAFVPWFNDKIKSNNTSGIREISKILIVFYGTIGLALSFFGKEIIIFLTPESYHDAWQVIPFISFAFVYHGVYYFFVGNLFYDIKGRGNKLIPFSTISAAVLNIILNIALIPIFGILGASIATFISKFALSLSLNFYYDKFLKFKFPELFLMIVPFVFFSISLLSYFTHHLEYELLWKLIFFSVILIVLIKIFWKRVKEIFVNEYINS